MDSDEEESFPTFGGSKNAPSEPTKPQNFERVKKIIAPKSFNLDKKPVPQVSSGGHPNANKLPGKNGSVEVKKIPRPNILKKRNPAYSKVSPKIKVPRPGKIKKMKQQGSMRSKISRKTPTKSPKKERLNKIYKKDYKFKVPTTKHTLASEILKRWWYGLPEWPPKDTNYEALLAEKNFYIVSFEEFTIQPE